ncbi:response regulator [Desulfobacula sp.]|uniref:response regulator n=1 Tax=Desulfobacula sp. TaxID=2593537 RepID=UPI00262A43AC|nr:response regulator [Desulfobacula sp.]
MFKTIRSKIILLVVGLMVATSISFIFITTTHYQAQISSQQYNLTKETLASTIRIIDNEFNDILSYEIDTIKNQRSVMKNIGTSLLSMVDSFHDLHKSGILTERLAKEKCLDRIDTYRYQEDHYSFVYDLGLNGISHPNKEMVGKKWTGFEDLKKKDALKLIRDVIKNEKKVFTVFMWPRLEDMRLVKHMGFFLYFPQWEWIIGVAHEMVDIEKNSLTKEKSALVKLSRVISQTNLNKIGGILIFDDNGTIILNTSKLKDIDFGKVVVSIRNNTKTQSGKTLNNFGELVEYRYTNNHQKELKQTAYAYSYKHVNWNVAAFFDWTEFKKLSIVIATRQFLLLFLVSITGIAVAVFISRKIAFSISRLAEYARQLPTYNFGMDQNPKLDYITSHNRDEDIKELVNAFSFMEFQLGKYIRELESHKKNLEELVNIRTNELLELNEELVIKTEAAEAATKTKSEFLANMSHEIRTPLNALLGFSELLSIELNDPRQKNYIDAMKTAGKSLLILINDILDLSKMEAYKMVFKYEPVNLKILFTEIEYVFKDKITNKGIRFVVDLAEDLPIHLILDETRIRQILLNLVGNAAKFTEKGLIKLTAQKQATRNLDTIDLIIKVEDTGLGIEGKEVNLIFELFKQSDGQISKKYGGTGLGLAICKRLTEAMGGQISVISKKGVGSTFIINLKNVKTSSDEVVIVEEQRSTSENGSPYFEKKRILIVDDNESNRFMLKELLSKFNQDVLEAYNGNEALLMVRENTPDIIIMDIRMPVMDGNQATKVLKSDPNTKHIPIIAFTGDMVAKTKTGALKKGYDGYLTKPVKIQELTNELSKYIRVATPDREKTKQD